MSLNFPLATIETFLFVLLRIGALLLALSFFQSRAVPSVFKFGFVFGVSLLVVPLLPTPAVAAAPGPLALGLIATKELLVGAGIGLAIRTFFAGVQLAGQMAGFQMGMAIANVMDPQTSAQVPILGQFLDLVALLTFLILDVHHHVIRAVVGSFEIIPAGGLQISAPLSRHLVDMTGAIFTIALQVGAPVIVSLLLVSVALGLVARTVPQMNIFIVAMPVKIVIGLLFLGLSLPYLADYLHRLFGSLDTHLPVLLRAMG